MINTIDKMRRLHQKARRHLIDKMKCDHVYFAPHTRTTKDLYGLFDAIAKRGRMSLYIQVKANKFPSLKPFQRFRLEHLTSFEDIFIMVWRDRKGWKFRWV